MSRRERRLGVGGGMVQRVKGEGGERRGDSVDSPGEVGEGLRAGAVGEGVDRGDATVSRVPPFHRP